MVKTLITIPKTLSFTKAIRKKCLEYTCNQTKEVELCDMVDCALFPYRFGCSPETKVKNTQVNLRLLSNRKNRKDES